jgi:putative oxidoreductase
MSDVAAPSGQGRLVRLGRRVIALLDAVPYALLALPLRAAVANVFWASGMVKITDWHATLALFAEEYKVPLLPPVFAAYLATTIELTAPPLLMLGLLTRPVAAVLLGQTAVIEVFVYPEAWPDHILWAAILLVLLCRGAGAISLDRLLDRLLAWRFGRD